MCNITMVIIIRKLFHRHSKSEKFKINIPAIHLYTINASLGLKLAELISDISPG